MLLNDSAEHDAEHFAHIYGRAVDAILEIRAGHDVASERLMERSECDLCLAFALAKIAASLGDEQQIETAGVLTLRDLVGPPC